MGVVHPLLDKPAPGWKYDLPGPNQAQTVKLHPQILLNAPNHTDEFYLDLARSTIRSRGVGIWLAICFLSSSIAPPIFLVNYIAGMGNAPPLLLTLSLLLPFVTSLWGGVYFWRMDVESPRDQPIRFNRLRRKVYVYRFVHDGRRPFSRSAWGVRVETYNWDDLRAEACSVYGAMGTGGFIETVTLAVVSPGTNKVIDRFHFAHGIQQGEMYWTLAQLFMQQGPQALPTFSRPPRDWNNEKVTFNLARRLAPKVKWPEDLDLESRTAP
ncbi:hypothetical protein D3C81_717650 [compost metagenome]